MNFLVLAVVTRLTDPRKLGLLMALVALAFAWVSRAAANKLGKQTPPAQTTAITPSPSFEQASTTSAAA